MRRPCLINHDLQRDGNCMSCKRVIEDAAYWHLWSGALEGIQCPVDSNYKDWQQGDSFNTTIEAPATPCFELGDIIPGQACGCTAKLRQCKELGQCTTGVQRDGVPCCRTCGHYDAGWIKPLDKRHLAYVVMPVAGNGTWQRNLDQLKLRLPLFNGRRLVAIMVESPTSRHQLNPPAAVKDYLAGCGCEFFEVPNQPALREVAAFHDLFAPLATTNDDEAIFFAHAKGVTHPARHPAHRWATVMYEVLLDYWPAVQRQLYDYPIAGCFKKLGTAFNNSDWHYSGTFFWLRAADLFNRNWQNIDQVEFGMESWPSWQFKEAEAASVFHTGRVPRLNLYSPSYWSNTVEPELARWLGNNQHNHTNWESYGSTLAVG